MALPTASDNPFPSILITEGTEPAAPAAGKQRLYIDSTSHHLKRTDSSGTDVDIETTGAGIAETLIDAKGDLIAGSAADTAARLAVGTNGYHLVADSGQATGLVWQAQYATINFIIDGGGSAITTGVKGYVEVPFAGTIVAVTTLLDASGSIVVDIWKDTYANYPPVDADSITAAAPPTVSAATKATDSTLTGWTTSITANDILGFNVDSITSATRATVALRIRRT